MSTSTYIHKCSRQLNFLSLWSLIGLEITNFSYYLFLVVVNFHNWQVKQHQAKEWYLANGFSSEHAQIMKSQWAILLPFQLFWVHYTAIQPLEVNKTTLHTISYPLHNYQSFPYLHSIAISPVVKHFYTVKEVFPVTTEKILVGSHTLIPSTVSRKKWSTEVVCALKLHHMGWKTTSNTENQNLCPYWVALVNQSTVKQLFILGHSEGTCVCFYPTITAKVPERYCKIYSLYIKHYSTVW